MPPFSPEQEQRLREIVREEIRVGMTEKPQHAGRLMDYQITAQQVIRESASSQVFSDIEAALLYSGDGSTIQALGG